MLSLDNKHLIHQSHSQLGVTSRNNQCLPYIPTTTGRDRETGLTQGIRSHVDLDYSRELVALLPDALERSTWSIHGWCEQPKVDVPVSEVANCGGVFLISPSSHMNSSYHQTEWWWKKTPTPVQTR